MKILVFSSLYPNRVQPNHGTFVEKRLLELCKRFPLEAHVVAPVPSYPRLVARRRQLPEYHLVPDSEVRAGIKIVHPRYPVLPGISWRIAPLLMYRACSQLSVQMHNEHQFDLVDAHFAFPDGVAAGMLARDTGLPFMVTARGSDINESPNHLLPRWFIKRSLSSADHIVAVSRRLGSGIGALGIEQSKISILPNGVDTEVFKPQSVTAISEKYGVKAPYLLSVGSLRELKGHHLVIEALAKHPELQTFSLLIAGSGSMRTDLSNQIADLKLDERVRLIGEVANEELPALYSNAALFVLASANEGCPNVVLEALACNARVAASNVGAVPDLLPTELHPFMFHERTPQEIGNNLVACINAPLADDIARQRALELGWEQTCSSVYHLMRGMIDPQ